MCSYNVQKWFTNFFFVHRTFIEQHIHSFTVYCVSTVIPEWQPFPLELAKGIYTKYIIVAQVKYWNCN